MKTERNSQETRTLKSFIQPSIITTMMRITMKWVLHLTLASSSLNLYIFRLLSIYINSIMIVMCSFSMLHHDNQLLDRLVHLVQLYWFDLIDSTILVVVVVVVVVVDDDDVVVVVVHLLLIDFCYLCLLQTISRMVMVPLIPRWHSLFK